jgi:hypothetical protein
MRTQSLCRGGGREPSWRQRPAVGERHNLQTVEECQDGVGGSVAARCGVLRCGPGQCPLFERKIGMVTTLSCPNHRAITAVSTPACSRCIAAVCRMTWGETFLPSRVGQDRAAAAVCLVMRRSNPSRLRAWPWRVGNSGSEGRPPRSSTWIVWIMPTCDEEHPRGDRLLEETSA